ncbi:hypothetical protein COT75_05355 [Candidatus Beckwithbacteria bacterium CG10_big_fil_rev_8_21_14_0_10_34_10]|uniref:Polysaccharide chain length determinant N-terminal domain-containing protein n=1 Tax=Candidatus Beckwithbacteria bacterium CG10_big_fil_rev_8_21_14_0_10_34_10 TaxID=1974495 RepID=A0A2H0W9Y5_9BACT|nr:MAG: hypothetical protein COT75_05355 [Candidatus Beckwithbacteria bacterium CG10_big_fil_rev_8_21_14_0_10_34_10]
MEPETEELLKKWLKIQIWRYRLSFIMWVFIVISFFASSWFTVKYIIPPFQKQIETTQSLLNQVSSFSKTSQEKDVLLENQNDFMKLLEDQLQ